MVCTVKRGKLCDDENCQNCFERSFASIPISKFWSTMNPISPRMVTKNSKEIYKIKCPKCPHTYETALLNATTGYGCPFCAIPSKKLCGDENCEQCRNKSFQDHPKAKFWSKLNDFSPREIFKSSGKIVWFDCEKCPHSFDTTLRDVTSKGQWCPFCAKPPQRLCTNLECMSCFEKSFASHPKSEYFSPENDVDPRMIFKASNKIFKFDCECCHSFEASLDHISLGEGTWCPFCADKKLCDDFDCIICFEKSFVGHPNSKYWDFTKNSITPNEVFRAVVDKFWFICKEGHPFDMSLNAISNGQWCPHCVNKTETIVYEYLLSYMSEHVITRQPGFEKLGNYKFDFLLNTVKLLIEIDGEQHFKQVKNWKSHHITQERDIIKMKFALENGYSIIRLYQPDVWNNKIDWKQVIQNHNKIHDSPSVFYYSTKPGLYDKHKELMQ